ncbi:MAG: efflux RND transporter periplasmic adaptor subunit [Actinobacteria bacterium]|nr:efflux RND transporter periplasmic adaptor subunit [Actinomycetota bacterium]
MVYKMGTGISLKEKMAKIKKRKILMVLLPAILLFVVVLIFTSCMGGIPGMGRAFTDESGEGQGGMETYEVVRGNISQEISVTGSVDSRDYATYALQVTGEILTAAGEGSTFSKGDLLVEIDDKEKQDSLFEIEKNLELSESSLRLAQLSYQNALDSNHISVQQATLNEQKAAESAENALKSLEISMKSADASSDSAGRALEKAEEILEAARDDSDTTLEQLSQYESNVESAEEKLESAELSEKSTELQSESSYEQALISQSSTYWSNLSSLQSAQSAIKQASENLKQTEIKLELAKAEYEDAKEDLGEYTVYAPYDGVVISSGFTVGQEISEGGTLSIISSDFIISCMVSESDIIKISGGQDASVDFDAYPDVKFSGVVEKIKQAYTEDSGIVYYEVLVSFENAEDTGILYGFSTNISILDIKAEDVLYVPLQAVYKEEGKSYVDVLSSAPAGAGEGGDAGEAGQSGRKTGITTGVNDYYNIEVISGLKEGDIVITSRS